MKFAKVIGASEDPKIKEIVQKAENKISAIFTELSLSYDNKGFGTMLGGDPFIFQLIYPLPHICDLTALLVDDIKKREKEQEEKIKNGEEIPEKELITEEIKKYRKQMGGKALRTAATDGRRYFWNPKFVCEQPRLGLRIVVMHEAIHAMYSHPSRRGSRIPRLWNIAVDYKVNFIIIEDLHSRGIKDSKKAFVEALGEYITLDEYAQFLKDPFHPPQRLAHLNPILNLRKMADPAYVDPFGDVPAMYYADHGLSDEMRKPESIYNYLFSQIPKCPKCGKLGKYKKPEEYKTLENTIKENNKKEDKKKSLNKDSGHTNHNHESDKEKEHQCSDDCRHDHSKTNAPPDSSVDDCCSECDGDDSTYVDPFGAGETLDDHIDVDVSEEDLAKRMNDAANTARQMAGKVPGGMEGEIGSLADPKITWEDFTRQQLYKKRMGFGKSDWLRPKSRPMFAGLYSPRKRDVYLKIVVAYDCSGSMSPDDIAYGLGQLQVIDEKGEAWLCPFDTVAYFDAMVKIKKVDKENLSKAKRKGMGGTQIQDFFNRYEEYCEHVDMIIVVSDGFIGDVELVQSKIPNKETSVLWLITSHNPRFKPPFGKVYHLRNEKL